MNKTSNDTKNQSFNTKVYDLLSRIPYGKVMTYGQIAKYIGHPRAARQVGYALSCAPLQLKLPWHRVINAKGEVSQRKGSEGEVYQQLLLETEGVVFNENGKLSLSKYRWQPEVPS